MAHSTPCDDADSINPSWREDSCHFFQSLRQTTAPRFSLFLGQPCLFRSVSASTVPSRTCFRFKNCRFSLSATTALPRTISAGESRPPYLVAHLPPITSRNVPVTKEARQSQDRFACQCRYVLADAVDGTCRGSVPTSPECASQTFPQCFSILCNARDTRTGAFSLA